MAPHAPPPEFSGTLDQHVDWIRDHLLVKIKHRKAAQFVDVFCDAAGFNLAQANALLIAARRLGFPSSFTQKTQREWALCAWVLSWARSAWTG